MKKVMTILSLMLVTSTTFAYDITFIKEKLVGGVLGQKCSSMIDKGSLDRIIGDMGISLEKVVNVDIVRCFDVTAPRETVSAPILTIRVQYKK